MSGRQNVKKDDAGHSVDLVGLNIAMARTNEIAPKFCESNFSFHSSFFFFGKEKNKRTRLVSLHSPS